MITTAIDELKLRLPTLTAPMKHRDELGIARETAGRNYDHIYPYDKYLNAAS